MIPRQSQQITRNTVPDNRQSQNVAPIQIEQRIVQAQPDEFDAFNSDNEIDQAMVPVEEEQDVFQTANEQVEDEVSAQSKVIGGKVLPKDEIEQLDTEAIRMSTVSFPHIHLLTRPCHSCS